MNSKIWVLTYTIGTNEGRKSRRLTCDTKAQAEMQQRVLGGEVVEYIRQPESFQVNWPEKMDVDAVLHEMRRVQNDPAAWKDLYLCGGDAESVRDPFLLVRQAHAEWSDRQFGNVGPVGPLKHLAKEASEPPKRRMTLASSPISSCWCGTQPAAPESPMSSWQWRWRKSWSGTNAASGEPLKMASRATT